MASKSRCKGLLSPTFSWLFKHPGLRPWVKACLGLHKVTTQTDETRLNTAAYTWDNGPNENVLVKTWDFSVPTEINLSNFVTITPVMDEETGHVVQPAHMGFVVVDFALSCHA